jgi:tRNA (adenine57-N1/adenine58-N1)-methyltransferase catalytic subunit
MSEELALAEHEPVILRRKAGDSLLLPLERGARTIEGHGVLDLSDQIGRPPGGLVQWAGGSYRIYRPTLPDLLGHLRRRAQIVTAKDALPLVYLAGIGPGSRVAEAGAGSGALTTVLAYFVGSAGRVYSFDRRPDFLDQARANVAAAGLVDRVEFALRDVATDGFGLTALDGIILDLPEPWKAVPFARDAVRVGGSLAAYVPTYNQLEATVRAFRTAGLEETRALELLERALHVGDGGTRPDFDMLGHTGFLAAGRRVS